MSSSPRSSSPPAPPPASAPPAPAPPPPPSPPPAPPASPAPGTPPPPPPPSPPRARPSRPPRPAFFLDNDDDEDDFFQGPSRAVTPFPPDTDPALVPLPSDSASTNEGSTSNAHASPQPRTSSPFIFRYSRATIPAGPPPSSFYAENDFTRQLTEASRTSSAHSFAAPPLPWLRDISSASPSATASAGHLTPPRQKMTFSSTLLTAPVEKPWLSRPDPWARFARWITRALFLLGLAAAALIVFFGFRSIDHLGPVCLLMQDNFNSLDTNVWTREVQLGGNNAQFQWYTASDDNSFIRDSALHILPTPTSLVLNESAIFNAYRLTLPDCTSHNKSLCSASSSNAAGTVINPVRSALISTRNSYNLRYGRVQVRAKMPQGDWLWPAISMLPVNESYGPWPMSGQIDIAQSRGNGLDYPAQGSNFISSALNWGPANYINAWTKTWGWQSQRRASYGASFHTYTLEWTEDFMRFYIDTRIQATLSLSFRTQSLFALGDFPPVVHDTILHNPWAGRGNNAPFDQPFYLTLAVAAGGTNGWFPDDTGGKPWVDVTGPASAMRDFAFHQDEWIKTWTGEEGMVVDWVKMWSRC